MAGYIIKAVIEDTHPPVWRRIAIPEKISFRNLHSILQTVFQWEDVHMHEFTFPRSEGHVVMKGERDDDAAVEEEQVLADEFFRVCKWIRYIYDFGDGWRHKLIFEKEDADYTARCARVLKYKGDSFTEDSGGIWGGEGDRIHFDIEQINRELQDLSFPVQKDKEEGEQLLELIQMEHAWSDFMKANRHKVRELAQTLLDKLDKEYQAEKGSDKDSEMAERVNRWIDFCGNKETSGEGELLKNVSRRSCGELLATMHRKGIQEYCKYMGVKDLAVDDIPQCARVVWEELKGHPEYLAYIFSWDELKQLMEFMQMPNGICREIPDVDMVTKALALGLFDLSEEWVNSSSYLVLRQTAEVRILIDHYTQAEWKRISKNYSKRKENCRRLLNLYSMMELEVFCQKYQEYYDSSASRADIQRCIYLSGTFCKELMTADTPEGVSYVASTLVDMERVLIAQRKLEKDVGYREYSSSEQRQAEYGFGKLYPVWGECYDYMVREYGLDDVEAEELMQQLYYDVINGRGADILWEQIRDIFILDDIEGYIAFWDYFLGACLTTGIPQLKGHSREEYGRMTGTDITELGVYENLKPIKKMTKTTHLYEMPLEFQIRIHKIVRRLEDRNAAGELELLLRELDNGNYELEYLLGEALLNMNDCRRAEKYFLNIRRAFPKDEPVQKILNTIKQISRQEEEEELTLWDMMDGKLPKSNVDTYKRVQPKIGRNDPCPCGSGKKYKKCCGR